jgi:phage gp46-like protein
MSDIALVWDVPNLRADWQQSGPALLDGLDLQTAVFLSIFSDRIAAPDDEIPDGTNDPRGSVCDEPDAILGSRLWLLSRAKKTPQVLNQARSYVDECLQWLLDDGVVGSLTKLVEYISVSGADPQMGALGITVSLFRQDGTRIAVLKYQYVWKELF